MKQKKQDIKLINPEKYPSIIKGYGEKPFRAKQLSHWLWKKHVCDFDMMTNLSAGLRNNLKRDYEIGCIKPLLTKKSKDRTIKVAFGLFDKNTIEAVLIPSNNRITACLSSQAGCALGCKFCATAKMGFTRNLYAYEIYGQLVELGTIAEENYNSGINNVVLMGMGEPLLNYDEVQAAIDMMVSEEGMGMSPSRITLSTVGIVDGIKRMADNQAAYNLAVSLHTADNKKRDNLIPANKKNNLTALKNAIKYFYEKTNTRITYEYLLLKGVNDSEEDAEKLAGFCRISPCKVNIIEYNSVKGINYEASTGESLKKFKDILDSKNMIVNIRRSKGADIEAACGQLAKELNKFKKK